MARKEKDRRSRRGLFGSRRRRSDESEPSSQPDTPLSGPAAEALEEEPSAEDQIDVLTDDGDAQAYEQDWYNSLRAFADQLESRAEQTGERPDGGAALGMVAVHGEDPSWLAEAGEELAQVAAVNPDGADPLPAQRPSLTSTDARERWAAVQAILEGKLTDAKIRELGALLADPDRDIRCRVVQALTRRADRVGEETIQRGLRDPADDVRAATVHLAAARGARDLARILPVVAARRWPLAQKAAFEVLPAIVALGIDDELVHGLLQAVGAMDSPPTGPEAEGLSELAAAIGPSRILVALGHEGTARLGAVRMLTDDTPEVLGALANLADDPIKEIRYAARAAGEAVAGKQAPIRRSEMPSADPLVEDPDFQMMAALARALQDPEESVRERSRSALANLDRDAVVRWCRRSLRSEQPQYGTLAAGVAETLLLSEVGADLLERTSALAPDDRAAFVGALTAIHTYPDALVGLIESIDESAKAEGVRLAWQVHGTSALEALRSVLAQPSEPARLAVLEVLGESADQGSLEAAQAVLEADESPAVRAAAIHVLGRGERRQRLAALSVALADADPDVRATAVEVLPVAGGPEVTELLLRAVGDADERTWKAGARHLAAQAEVDPELGWTALRVTLPEKREHVAGLLTAAGRANMTQLCLVHMRSADPQERALAIELGGRFGSEACIDPAVEALGDPESAVRRAAAIALGSLRSSGSAKALGRALSDPEPEVRTEVVRALGVIDDESVLGFLVSALNDPDSRVRAATSEVLTQWSSPAVARRLAEVLASPRLRGPASDVLLKMGPAAVELLIDVLIEGTREIVPVVGDLLQSVAGLEAFVQRLGSVEATQRLRAVAAVASIGGSEAADALIAATSDPNERVRVLAITALGDLGDTRAFDAVKQSFLSDPAPAVVAAAELTLSRLKPDEGPDTFASHG